MRLGSQRVKPKSIGYPGTGFLLSGGSSDESRKSPPTGSMHAVRIGRADEIGQGRKVTYPYSEYATMLAKKTSKNQITLPKAIIERLPKTDYFELSLRGEEIVLRPVLIESKGTKLDLLRKKIEALGLTKKDVDAAIRLARSR